MQAHTDMLRHVSQPRLFKKGTNMFFQGEIPRRGIAITEGIVRAYSIASSGEERTIAFYTNDDLLPLSWLIGATTNTLFYYEAITDVRVIQFNKEDFSSLVATNLGVVQSLFEMLSRDNTAALMRINGLEQSRANEKVAFVLYYLIFRYGTKKADGLFTIGVTLRHNTLASLVGLSRESTTKILGQLQRKKIISYKNGIYTVDKQLLENYIGEDAFRDVELRV